MMGKDFMVDQTRYKTFSPLENRVERRKEGVTHSQYDSREGPPLIVRRSGYATGQGLAAVPGKAQGWYKLGASTQVGRWRHVWL